MKMLSFMSQLIMTRMAVKLSDMGSCSMKSMLIECHRQSGIGSSCNNLYG